MSKLIVIYYHDIVEAGNGYSYQRVEVQNFEEQMRYLHEQGYSSLLFEDLDKSIPDKSILVTFDDGFRTVYERAVPIMRKYGIKGNIFLPTKYVEQQEKHFMTWDMLKKVCEQGEFSVAAHTHSHADVRTLNDITMHSEIEKSNYLVQEHLGIITKSFCMPYGKYDCKSMKRLRNISDYQYIFGSFYGHVRESKLKSNVLPRIGISNDDSIAVFRKKLEGKLNWKGPIQRMRLHMANLKGERITQYDIE